MFWTVKKPPLPFTVFFSKNQKKALLHTGTKKKTAGWNNVRTGRKKGSIVKQENRTGNALKLYRPFPATSITVL